MRGRREKPNVHKRFVKVAALVLCLALATSLGVGCKKDPEAKEPIYLASANPMTGDCGQFGIFKVEGIRLAIEQANAAGGINGRMIELIVEDDMGNPREGANVAQRIASNNKIVAVIGHWNSSCTLAGIPIYDSAGIPGITCSINEAISGASDYMFRISITDSECGKQLADYVVTTLGKSRVAIFYANNDYGKGQDTVFSQRAQELGANIVARESYIEGQSRDFTAQLTNIKRANPDVLFLAGYYTEAAMIVQQMHRLGLNIPVIGPDGLNNEMLVSLGGADVEGVMAVSYYHQSMEFPGTAEYAAAYKAKYGYDSDTFAALAYDATRLVIEAMKANGPTREGIRQYLAEVEEFPGVAGPITFNELNDVTRDIIVLIVRDGVLVPADVQPGH
jgi:branched-chain amino acid transport system substrate-binding protein